MVWALVQVEQVPARVGMETLMRVGVQVEAAVQERAGTLAFHLLLQE